MTNGERYLALEKEFRDFKQEVNDAVADTLFTLEDDGHIEAMILASNRLVNFVLPKIDPLAKAMIEIGAMPNAGGLRAALDALGFEIREKTNDSIPNN